MILDQVASIWRKVGNSSVGYQDTQVYGSITCAIIPISKLSHEEPYARESTHLIWVPHWIVLHKEDVVRYGRQIPGPANDIVQWMYTITSRSRFIPGIPQANYYARELD